MARGKFITLEGGEGTGKSTQVKHLEAYLSAFGIKTLTTREVGGAPGAEEIRELWLSKEEGHWDPITELLLIMAARREHLVKTIWPALEVGTWVISDRFVDSSRAYQGLTMGLGLPKVDEVYKHIADDFWPDMTLLFDMPAEEGLKRMKSRQGPDDRYQRQKLPFHEKLRESYLSLAKQDQKRFAVINAGQEENAVAKDIGKATARRFGLAV